MSESTHTHLPHTLYLADSNHLTILRALAANEDLVCIGRAREHVLTKLAADLKAKPEDPLLTTVLEIVQHQATGEGTDQSKLTPAYMKAHTYLMDAITDRIDIEQANRKARAGAIIQTK
jgi:hypothetical protein